MQASPHASSQVFAMAPFTLRKLPFAMRHVERVAGAWQGASAGGCANYDSVVDNPRFVLTLEQPTDLQFELSGPARHSVGIELHALPAAGENRAVATSGSYRKGFCLLEVRGVPAGRYALTPATFEPRQEGAFSIVVGSSQPLTARPLQHEAHGLQRQALRGEWSAGAGTAAGSQNNGCFHRNPQFRMVLSQRTDVLLRLRCGRPAERLTGARPSLGLSVYRRAEPLGADEANGRSTPTLCAGDGVYAYPPGGALVARTPLDAGSYVLVPSTFRPQNSDFELVVYAAQGACQLSKLA